MHVRYSRAAVAVEARNSAVVGQGQASDAQSARPPVLWASRGLAVREGRLIGLRLRNCEVEVAVVSRDSHRLRWVHADAVLTEAQAAVWLKTSKFMT